MGESGYAISSWSASAGYSASMLTEDAKVDSSSTRQLLPSSVNISAEYPALPDHDSMNNPSISFTIHRANQSIFFYIIHEKSLKKTNFCYLYHIMHNLDAQLCDLSQGQQEEFYFAGDLPSTRMLMSTFQSSFIPSSCTTNKIKIM